MIDSALHKAILLCISRMEPRKTGGYYWLVLITNLLTPYRYWGARVLWGKTQVLEQCCCDTATHWALRKRSFTGGVASMHVLRWLSQQAFPNNVSGAYTVVRSQLAAIWEQMPSGCQIVILSFSIQLVFLWIGFWPFFPREELCLSQTTSDLSPVKEMKVWVTIASGETIYKSRFQSFKWLSHFFFFFGYITFLLQFLKEISEKHVTATSDSLLIQSVH